MWKEDRARQERDGVHPFEMRTLAHLPAAHIAGAKIRLHKIPLL
jgi:hypothetical protein